MGAGLVGCGDPQTTSDGPTLSMSTYADPTSPTSAHAPSEPVVYDCVGVSTTAAGLEAAPPVADPVDHPGIAAFAANTDRLDGWRAVIVEPDMLGAIRARSS